MKKIFAVLMTMVMIFSLSACGENAKILNNTEENETESKAKWVLVKATSQGMAGTSLESIKLTTGYSWNQYSDAECEYSYTYDDNGNMITRIRTDNSGRKQNTEWTYDSHNNVLSISSDTFNGSSSTTGWTKWTYSYDNDGNILTLSETTSSGQTSSTEYTYDNKGQKIREIIQHPNGFNGSHDISYTYHDNGQIASRKCIIYKENGSVSYTTEMVYDMYGNTLHNYQIMPESDAKIGFKKEYVCDEDGKILSIQNINQNTGENIGEKTVYSYDNDGKLLEIKYDNGIETYSYNSNGECIKEQFEFINDGVKEIDYEIIYDRDNKGNLLKKTKTEYDINGQPKTRYIYSYEYDSNGNKISQIQTDYNDKEEKTRKYDKNGNIIEYTVWNMNKPESTKFIATFEYEKL